MDTPGPAALFEFLRPGGILPALLVLTAAYAVSAFVARVLSNMGERFADRRLVLHQIKAVLRLVVFFVGILIAASFLFSFSSEALLALGGTIAVAAGFAFKDLLASMIAGIIILVDRPFQVGDRITFGEHYGEVVEIGLRTVRLVTLDDNLVTIPNNKFLTDAVASGNAGELDMLVQIDFHIGADQNLSLAKRLVGEALTSSHYAFLEKPWTVVVSPISLGDAVGLRLRAKVYVIDVKYEKALETDVTEQVLAAFQHHDIEPPAILHRTARNAA